MNKIALFKREPWSLSSWLISLVTGCPYTHAAIYVDSTGLWVHSSESVGYFTALNPDDFAGREVATFEFEGDLTQWLKTMRNVQYDWKGAIGWLFNADDKKRFYCFEAALGALVACGHAQYQSPVNGCYVLGLAKNGVQFGRFEDIA